MIIKGRNFGKELKIFLKNQKNTGTLVLQKSQLEKDLRILYKLYKSNIKHQIFQNTLICGGILVSLLVATVTHRFVNQDSEIFTFM